MGVVNMRNAVPLAAAAGLLAALAVLYAFDPAQEHVFPTCMLYEWTGILCPGCGGLRATHQMLHGDLAAALRHNPLLVLGYPWLAYGLWRILENHRTGRALPSWLSSGGAWTILVLLVGGFILFSGFYTD
ncbi:MAG: DUF2752 domain-containing protein, partial [bacterium]|nr:DUF2752 domain-containing protein [bacterium]